MFSVKKNWQLQLQVSNICHINNMFRTRCLSLVYSVNLAETSHTHLGQDSMCSVLIQKFSTHLTRCTRGDTRFFFCTYKTYLYAQN